MDHRTRARLTWVEEFDATGNAGFVCRRYGVSRPPLRKWVRRYRELGLDGLRDQSRRPKRSPGRKVDGRATELILQLRARRLGPQRNQSELQRLHGLGLSRETIRKVLVHADQPPLKATRLRRKGRTRYERAVPGERVQMDTCKIAPGVYQYTAVDDCTRFRVLATYPRRSAANSLLFLELVIEELPFHIQRGQTDRGMEFFAERFQRKLKQYAIKFRPNKPGSPHLNAKVERSQKTDLEEFWAIVDVKGPDLGAKLRAWQDYYNHERPHSSLGGKTPWERWYEAFQLAPFGDEIEARYDDSKERIRHQNYKRDLQLVALGR